MFLGILAQVKPCCEKAFFYQNQIPKFKEDIMHKQLELTLLTTVNALIFATLYFDRISFQIFS